MLINRHAPVRRSARRLVTSLLAVVAGLALVVVPGSPAQAAPSDRFGFNARYSAGAWNVDRTQTYTLFATAKHPPQYIDAAPYPKRPSGNDYYFERVGGSGKHKTWALQVKMNKSLRSHKYWNVGVRTGHTLHRVKIRVFGKNDSRGFPSAGSTHQG